MSTGFSKSVIPGTHKKLKILWKMFLLTSGGQNVPKSGTGQPKKRGTASATVVLWGVSKRAIWETWGFIFYYSSPLPYNNLFNVKSFIYDSSLCSSGKKITGQVLQQGKVWKPREFRAGAEQGNRTSQGWQAVSCAWKTISENSKPILMWSFSATEWCRPFQRALWTLNVPGKGQQSKIPAKQNPSVLLLFWMTNPERPGCAGALQDGFPQICARMQALMEREK